MTEAAATMPKKGQGKMSAFWKGVWRFFISSPMMLVSIAVGIVCGILWNDAKIVAIVIFILLSIYTLVIEIIDIIKGWMAHRAGSDILAVIAIISATLVGTFWAAWIIDLMVFTGGAIEDFAQSKAGENLTKLMENAPKTAHLVDPGDMDAVKDVQVEKISVGDVLLVKPGETIPVDGVLVSREASVDMSMINGEPVPADLQEGDKVLSGGVNQSTALYMKATAAAKDSEYQQILKLVESANDSRAPIVKTADLLAVPFTVVSLVIGIIAWACSRDPGRFVQVMVLATPCPLLIAAPVAYMGGIGRLAKHSIIVKSQGVLEQMSRVSHVFFDKTGTLTSKDPEVYRVEALPGFDKDEVLRLAGALEGYSVHILAKGISKAAEPLWGQGGLPSAEEVEENPGNGISGKVEGHKVLAGKLQWLEDTLGQSASFPASAPDEIGVFVAVDGKIAGRIVLKDLPRPNSKAAIEDLKKLGVSKITMVTGDRQGTADAIASQLGIGDVKARLLPEEKLAVVANDKKTDRDKDSKGEKVIGKLGGRRAEHVTMMVGDGVNDAPVLASSDIGIAMTDGSATVASESAQAVIMNDEILAVPRAIAISRQTKSIMLQAVLLGICLAIVLMILA
ncbi:MAG: cadmium-translocating P-type ATPase, partial [Aeriscardovia sp.]|nr:cadmium-translocating P-type ATPase [Aeriscardovia sp.]